MAFKIEEMTGYRSAVIATGALTGALLFIAGCGTQHNLAPVSGVVTVGDRPLVKAGITFTPVEGGRPAWATTNEEGRFQLSTMEVGDGALVGDHVVTIVANQVSKVETPVPEDEGLSSVFAARPKGKTSRKAAVLDPKYAERSTSDLRFTVLSGESNVAEFKFNGK
ncbi:hypothetical protein NG895_23920 [Aeoliella sp. ICT_H6.2]|uniref:Carboxypeptidase regulatory-like domain-containing protein n=1 Tax=Aeoliella straminimaris TaxID=2954799 RepID=A0A9X2FEY4_9BACT|nr:hypothetical protein [Aeoliella straminimaris]MCO6046958.1 hypothetical protein [Aeoliella straminimaris]